MKLKRISIMALACAALSYTSCKKSSTTPTVSTQEVSTQVALNLAQTLYGGFGAFDVTQGLNAPLTVGVSRNQVRLNMTRGRLGINTVDEDPTCGLSVDTALNYSTTVNNNSASVKGSIKFTFTCTNGVASGFNIADNLNITESTPDVSGSYIFAENFTVQTTDPDNSNAPISLNGTMNLSDNLQYKTGSKATTNESYNYTLTSIMLDPTLGDIASGTATFSTKGTNTSGTWNYTGTVVFLGGHVVKITINGESHTINLLTGLGS
jgi:hypothetical protein